MHGVRFVRLVDRRSTKQRKAKRAVAFVRLGGHGRRKNVDGAECRVLQGFLRIGGCAWIVIAKVHVRVRRWRTWLLMLSWVTKWLLCGTHAWRAGCVHERLGAGACGVGGLRLAWG